MQLLPSGVPATPSVPGDQAELGSAADDRGTERGAGAATAQRPTGTRRGQDAAGSRRVPRHAIQEDLHV